VSLPELLAAVQQAGIHLSADGDTLKYDAPRGALTPDLRAALLEHKATLLAVLERLQAMRHLAVAAPRPLAYARAWAKGGPGRCFSCGDPLDLAEAYGRCTPCDIAADVFYATVHEGGHRVVF
jgi:hypothetical protein